MGLFATTPVDEVTVQDIAGAVDMTPAAVYYHFASKEQILIEGMQHFRDQLLHQLRAADPAAGIGHLLQHLIAWTARHRVAASVYMVSSIGLNQMVEALRRDARVEMIDVLGGFVREVRGRISKAEAGVIAVALVSLVETSLASMLNQDASYRGLGTRRFSREVAAIGERIAGTT
jgi:AcrR family transcriptional regulator